MFGNAVVKAATWVLAPSSLLLLTLPTSRKPNNARKCIECGGMPPQTSDRLNPVGAPGPRTRSTIEPAFD